MAEESKKLSFNPETGKWENIPEEEKIRNNKNFKVGGKTVAVLYTYKPFWSVYDTVLLVADDKEAHYTVTPYQRYVNFSKADNQEYDYYGAIANQRVRYDLALRNPELVPRYEDNIFGLGIQPVFDDLEMAKDYAERTRNKIVATPKEILGNYFVFLNKPQAEYTRNDYITMVDHPIPNMFNNITYRVPVYLTSQADMFSVVDTLKDEGYDIKGDGVKVVWHIDFDKEENAKNFARHLHDLMVDNSKLSKPYSDLLDLFRNPNSKADEHLYRRIDTMEEYTKSMSRYRDGAFDATLEGKNIFTLDRITKDLPQTEIASVRYDNGKITFTGKDGNTYRLEHLSEESIKNLINIEMNIIESEERARSPKDIPYYYSVFDLTEDYMKEEYDKASVTDDKARFLELAKEADWDYNLSTDLIYKSPLRKEGDEIIAKDNKYTVVYNKDNGESYHVYRNITEQDVRDLIISSSSKLDLGDNPTADVKNLASLIEKEKAVNETNVIPEKVSFDNKEPLKAYITDYCNKHGWDSDLNHIDVSKITDMSYLFSDLNIYFKGDISKWDVSNVKNMEYMFAGSYFNEDLNGWNTSKVENMSHMFIDSKFNGDINQWNVSNVTDMSEMFAGSQFDGDIGNWNVSNVTNMAGMFAESDFNQPLVNWNVSNVTNMNSMFAGSEFNQPFDNWDISKVEDMSWMFANNDALEKIPDWKLSPSVVIKYMFKGTKFEGQEESLKRNIPEKVSFDTKEDLKAYITDYCNLHGWNSDLNHIDVSRITDMSGLFMYTEFNGDISKWDVSNVTDMSEMFAFNIFNGDISEWDVSNVKDMSGMFIESPFNQTINDWDVSNVKDMSAMFNRSSFNQPLNNWNTSKVTNMSGMFAESKFNQPLDRWNTKNVINMSRMFAKTSFNQPIGNWNTGNVTNMNSMLSNSEFNQPLNNWNTSNVINMSGMFEDSFFNQPINDWDVSNVKDMTWMFAATPFNQSINDWDVSNVKNMSAMFHQSSFNQTLDNWNVSNVKNMSFMFSYTPFNQSLDNWDTSKVEDMTSMFKNNNALEKMPDWKLDSSVVLEDMFRGTKFEGQEESLKRSIPEKVSFDNKEALKAYITDYCNNHGWDSDLNHIDVSKITDMSGLFMFTKFNGDISQWDVSNVKDMSQMFYNSKFNQPLDKWNTGNVKTMERMFYDSNFNHPLDNWNVSKVENMSYMFKLSSFNQPIDNWDVSNVKDMSYMFEDNKALEKMPDWKLDPSIITKYMFAETKFSGKEFQYKVEDNSKIKFLHKEDLNNYIFDYCNNHGWDSDLNHIDVSGITDMSYLFYSTTFTGDISKWNTSNVVNMNSMFSYSQFNGDISNWDVSKVKDMRFMFEESPFSQSLDKWDMSNVRDVSHMFANTPLEGKELKLKNNTHMESRSYTLPEEKEQGMAKEPSAATTASDLYSPEAVVARIKARISASMKTGNIPLSSLTTAVATKFKQLYSGARNLTTTSDTREVSLDVDCRYAFDKALAYASKHDGKWLNIKDNAYPITIPFNSPLTHYGAVLSALTAQEKGYATNVFCGAESLKQMGIELKKGEQPISVPIDNIDGQMIKKLYNIDQTTMSKDLPTKYNQYFTKYSSKAKPESLYLHKCHEAYIHGREGQMLRMFRMGDRFVAFDNDAKAIENALSGKDFNYNHRSVNTSDVYESKYDRTLGGLVMSINSKYMEQVIAHISPEVGKISIHDAKNMIENNNTPDKVYDLFHDFIQSRADNFGVKVESCDYARTHFDSENNTLYLRGITDYSKPKSIIDKEVELGYIFRALADMAQKRIGLHNLGLDNLKPEDAKKYSALLSEISAGSHLLQRNLPARISDDNKPLIPYWRKELRENPNIKAIIEKGVNNIHEMMTNTKIQKYGENMSVSGVVNRKPRLMTITEDLGGNINYINHEATVVYDPKKNRADVLLPTGASPYSFNEIAGMEKDVFTKALSAKGINEINFFNRDGYCAMRYPNIYFDEKNIEVVTVKNGNVIKIGDVDVKDEIERTSKVKINNVILIRNDDRRFELCIYPDGEKPLSIEPDFDDIDKFFKILKMPNKNESSLLREAMGQKYYYKAQEHPEIKTSLLEPSVSDEIKNRLDKVVVTKDYNTNKPILIASIDGELQPVTNISVDQYQRMWLVESEEYRSEYKYALASKVFAEKLNLANSEKSDISVDTNDTQEKKPEPVSVQSAKGSVENGEGEDQQDTTPDETIEQDEKKEIRRGGRGR